MMDEIVATDLHNRMSKEHTVNRKHKKHKHKPIVTLNPLEKYPLVDDARMHNEYTPATAQVSTTLIVINVDEKNTELTLVTALLGVAEQELEEITNADTSPDTFTSPTPLVMIVCSVPLIMERTFGVNEVNETMLRPPASKYGELGLQRTHKRYTPATQPLIFIMTVIDAAEFHMLEEAEFGRTIGLIEVGEKQEMLTTNAETSLLTLDIEDPKTLTIWLEDGGTAIGVNDVIDAKNKK